MQTASFGDEIECGECEYRTNDLQDLDEHRSEHEHERRLAQLSE